MDESEYKFRFDHFRVPKIKDKEYPKRGMPGPIHVLPYSRRKGWYTRDEGLGKTPPFERGGFTQCNVMDGDEVVARGTSWCSFSDNFSYKMGRIIAQGRALAELE